VTSTPVTLEANSVAARRLCNFLALYASGVDPDTALAMARGAVALSPDSESYNALAGILNEIPGAEQLQIDAANTSIDDNPDNWAAWHNLSLACLRSYNWERAKATIEIALTKLPAKENNPYLAMQAAFVAGIMGDHAEALVNLAEAEDVAERITDRRFAQRVRSECGIARFVGYAHLKQWENAFAALETRHKLSGMSNVLTMAAADSKLWRPGMDPRRPVGLVYLEWGFGDQIQFARYVADLIDSKVFREVWVACSPQLSPVISTLPGVDCVLDRDALVYSILDEADFVAVLDLMADHWKRTGDPIKTGGAYMSAPPIQAMPGLRIVEPAPNFAHMGDEETAAWHERAAALNGSAPVGRPSRLERQPGKIAVAFSWQGDPRQTHDWNRRVPLAEFGAWAKANADRFTFHSMQSKFAGYGEPWAGWPDDVPIQDCSGATDFGDLAALVSECDVFVGQCGGLVHLAGSIGKGAIVLLASSHDWRWDSWLPLYNSVMGLVQDEPGDWSSVFRHLTDAILQNIDDPAEAVAAATYNGETLAPSFQDTRPEVEPETDPRPTAETTQGETQL